LASPLLRHLVAAPADSKLPAGVALPAHMQMVANVDPSEALRHLQTLINVATKADNPDLKKKLLREMRGVIDNALAPKPPPAPTPFRRSLHLRCVKYAGTRSAQPERAKVAILVLGQMTPRLSTPS
jgi:hypothetical protein